MTTFIDKIMAKLLDDPIISKYFLNTNLPLVSEKFKQYMTFLTGGSQHWIGKSMKDTHAKLGVTDEQFDKFVQYTVDTLKEMKVKMDCLKETVVLINTIREQVVIKEDPISEQKPLTIYDHLGQMNGINKITEWLYEKIYNDEEVSSFFKKTN